MLSKKPSYIGLIVILLFVQAGAFSVFAQGVQFCSSEILPKNASKQMLDRQAKFEQDYQKIVKSSSFQSRNTKYTLPVVFHVIHNGGSENISDAQVIAGLNHLNNAFQNIGYYDDQIGEDIQVQFCLAKRDPDDNATTGINHVQSALTNLNMESQDIALKNVIRWNPTAYINIWIVNEICSGMDAVLQVMLISLLPTVAILTASLWKLLSLALLLLILLFWFMRWDIILVYITPFKGGAPIIIA